MRAFWLLTILISLTASPQTADTRISLSVSNAPLEQVFKEIKRQSGFEFVYTRGQIKKSVPVTVQFQSATLSKVLDACFKDQPFTYLVEGKFIALRDRHETPGETTQNPPAVPDVKGRVVGIDGQPIPGATVRVKSSGAATACNENGAFSLPQVKPDDELLVTSIGYEPRSVPVNGMNFIVIVLSTAVSQLDQTIVIGYGKTTKRFSTGSVSKLTAEEIAKQPVSNPLAALQGRIPGLTVTASSGLPGSSFSVQIRGQNSLLPNPNLATLLPLDQPLFIVDGVPLAAQNTNLNQLNSISSPGLNSALNNSYGGISPFNSILPSEIESIEVLRDADATAIYGSRGANGVILITTKKGTPGKTKVSANVYTGVSRVGHTMPMMTTEQYLQMRREAIANDGNTPDLILYSPGYAPDILAYDTTKYTNWKNYFTGNHAPVTDVTFSLSGGTQTTSFRLAAGYNQQGYVFPGDFSYKRSSVSSSLHHSSLNQKLQIDFTSALTRDDNNSSGAPNLLSAYTLEPNYPDLKDASGNLVWAYNGVSLGGSYGINNMNPLAYLMEKYSIKTDFLSSHFQIEYHLLPNLSLRSSLGYNSLTTDEYSGKPAASQSPDFTRTASADFGSSGQKGWIVEPQVEYSKHFGSNGITALVGGTFQKDEKHSTQISGWGYSNDALIESIAGAPNKSAADAFSEYKYNAIFGRLGYIAKQKYILNLNARRDGSSRFGPGKQFGNFGSVGAGWIFSEESFVKKGNLPLSYGKLRASYGTTGNDNSLSDYQYIARWAPTNYSYGGSQGYLPQNLYNPDFSWALTRKLEAALDLGWIENRLLLNVTWYRNRSGNQLVFYQLPSQTGFNGVTENWSALVENSGFEFSFQSKNIQTRNFDWSSSFNLTIPKNRLVSFPDIETSSYAVKYVVGQPLSVLNKFRYAGVNDSSGLFEFFTADGKVSSSPANISGKSFNDVQVIGDLDPKFYGGLSNSFSYKEFHLDLFFEFKKQMGANFLSQIYNFSVPGFQYNQPAALLSRWQKPGDRSDLQKFTATYGDAYITGAQYFSQSSGVFSDASYVRCKSLSASYDLPSKALKKIKSTGCRVYVQAQNVFTLTNYRGDDPETQNFYGIPPLKIITAGAQINF